MLQELLSIVLPVFGCALVGFIWKRVKPELDEETLSELTVYIGSPCLIFHALVTAESSPEALRSMGLYALIGISSTIALSAVFLRMARIEASSFLGPLSFGNTGNLGIPICFFAFGNEGKALGIAYFGVSFLMNSVVGELLFSGHFALKRVLRSPLVYAAILSVIVVGFELEVPTTVLRTTELLGGLAIPLMLIALGASLARLAGVKMQKASLSPGCASSSVSSQRSRSPRSSSWTIARPACSSFNRRRRSASSTTSSRGITRVSLTKSRGSSLPPHSSRF